MTEGLNIKTAASARDDEAARWVARLDASDIALDANDERSIADAYAAADPSFAEWLSASFENRTAFLRAHAAWSRADRLAALSPPATVVLKPRRFALSRVMMGGIAATLFAMITAAVVLYPRMGAGPETYQTAIGGRETVPLADGSRLELNTDTRLVADLSGEARVVVIEKGEAFFDVAHDEARPFIVEAGDKRVTVLGTKFTVKREGGEVEVIVAEGKVRIDASAPEVSALQSPTIVEKGAVVLARAEGVLVANKSEAELSAELGWRNGLLIFDQMDLAGVAEEFNRYNRVKIEIDDPELAAIRIGGSFKADNVDGFARLMKDGYGLRIEREKNKIVIKS